MTIITQPQPHFIVDTESERNTGWPDGSRVYCKDTKKSYNLISNVFELIGPGSGSGATWGEIAGTISVQTDLSGALDGKSATTHNHNLANLSEKSYTSLTDKPSIPTPASSVVNETSFGATPTVGTDTTYAREGHTHGTPANPITAHESSYSHSDIALNTSARHSNTNDPTTGQKNALAGTSGTPGDTNKFVTNSDSRNSDSRTPTTHSHPESDVTNLTTDLGNKVTANGAITGATKTKLTYDAKGLVTVGADATTADIADSTNKRYVTDAQLTVIGNTSGTNTGDSSGHSALAPINNPSFTTNITTPAITLGATALTSTAAEYNNLHGLTLSGSNTGDNAANSSSMYIGTTSHALNRSSGAETLAGITLTTPVIGAATGTSVVLTGAITSSGAGIGYATGAGGTVTQGTSRATGVTLNKLCGNITMFSAAVAAQAVSTFTLTNSFIAATDMIVIRHISTTNGGAWNFSVVAAAGTAAITVRNVTTASITEATPLRFTVIKGVTA